MVADKLRKGIVQKDIEESIKLLGSSLLREPFRHSAL